MDPTPRRHGLTSVELLVPIALLSIVAAAWWTFSSGAAARYAAPEPNLAVREQSRRALNEMADELRLAPEDSVRVEPGRDGPCLAFRTRAGSSITYTLEPTKEAARLVRVQDGQSITLVDGLRPGGFSARRETSVLMLSLSPATEAPLQTAIALRSQAR